MLAQARVKTITVHTRKQAIAIFEELKNKINAAFESQSLQSLQSLLAVIRIIYYLAPLPKFLSEINTIGTLPVTGFLENLLIKFRTNTDAQAINFRRWISALLTQFERFIPILNLKQVKGLKEINISAEEYRWSKEAIKLFISKCLQESINAYDPGLLGSSIILFRNFLVFCEGNASEAELKMGWEEAIKYLTKGSWIINNITREETAISINYFLCLKQRSLCLIALQHGVINYLLQILNGKFIFESFGKRIIQFLRYLMFNITPELVRSISIDNFQETLSKFIIKYSKSTILSEVRSLMCLLNKKIQISHQARLQRIYGLFDSNKQSDEQQIFKHLSIISLYAQNYNMSQFIIKDHSKFINYMITSPNEILVKMILELLSLGFKTGKLGTNVGDAIITKVFKIVSDEDMKDRLNVYRKRILIDFVKSLTQMLENKEHYEELSAKIKKIGLDKCLWTYSDCTNYDFEKEMISFMDKLGENISHENHQNQRNVFYRLQEDFIQKSKTNFNKPTFETYQEISLLDHLFAKCQQHQAEELAVHPDLSLTLCNYIRPVSQSNSNLLDSIELEQKEQIRRKLNLAVSKFLQKLLKLKQNVEIERTKMIELAASEDQLEDVRPILHHMLTQFSANKDQPYKDKKNQEHNHQDSQTKVKHLVSEYFQTQQPHTRFLIDLSQSELQIVISEMSAYENEANLLKFLQLLLQLSQSQLLCLQIFLKFGSNLAVIYNYILANSSEEKKQPILLLDTLFMRLIKLHIDLYFNDQYMEVNYWLEIVATIDFFFQVFFTKKRIILLDLIFQYLDMNKILDPQNVVTMMSKHSRKELVNDETFHNKGQTLGYCLGILLRTITETEVEGLALHHKQNATFFLKEGSELVNTAKFVALYYLTCQQRTFYDFHLEDWAEQATYLLEMEIKRVETIISHASQAALKLRRINHYAQLLDSLNRRKDLAVKKPLLLAEQGVLINTLKYLLYYIEMFQGQQFKRYYLGEIITTIMTTLASLYRHNFKYFSVNGGDIIQCFDSLLSINTDGIKDSVCQIMRVLLLKKQIRMMSCQTLTTCKTYRDSLSPISQQHIYFCERIQHILYEDGDLEEQLNAYFEDTLNNRKIITPKDQNSHISTTSAYLISDQQSFKQAQNSPKLDKKESIELEEPLFLQFASEISSSPEQNNKKIGIEEDYEDKSNSERQSNEILSLRQISSNSLYENGQNRQLQFERSTQIIDILDNTWNEQQLIEAIQKYLESPQPVQLKGIIAQLVPLSSKKYYNLLVQLFLKTSSQFVMDKEIPRKISLRDIHEKIISCIPAQFCQADEDLYEILASGIQGAKLGLKYKNVGLRGLQIYAKKFMNSLNPNDISFYAQLLGDKKNFQELKFLKACKIYEVVNEKVPYFIKNNQSLIHMCNFVVETCKYPPLCNSYEIVPSLCNYVITQSLPPSTRAPILNTLQSLCKNSDKQKKPIQNAQFLGQLIQLLQKTDKLEQGYLAELLMMGADQNAQISQLYQKLSLEEILLAILRNLVIKSEYHYQTFVYSLKIIEMLANLPQSAIRILKGGLMSLCRPIADLAVVGSNFDVLGVTINILRNLLQQMELNLSKVLVELEKDGFLDYLLFVGEYLSRCHQIESYLGIFCRLITNSSISKRLFEKIETVLKFMNDVARDQLVSHTLLEQWMKVLFLLAESHRYSLLPKVLKSNIFFSGANCLRSFNSLSQGVLGMNNHMMREINSKLQIKGMMTIHGYADFLVQILRMSNLPIDEYLKILTILSELFKNRHFASKLCTQLFAVVMTKLQKHWKDEIAICSIALLKSIKKSVEVTSQFGSIMLQFFGKFLTQSAKISSYDYYHISREVICLLSYFLIFNEQIRFLFRNRLVLQILKNWIKIAKALNYEDMPQSFKLFYYSVYCQKSLFIDLCDINSKNIAEAEAAFQRGWKCNLYRINGTYKNAVLKIDKSKVEILAFKYPDGIIKDKYRIHLKDLLVIEKYQSEKEILFAESAFTKGANPFQHKVNPQHCLTLLCLCDHNYEVREISIEMEKKADLEDLYWYAKILVSKWAENQIEEESKVWQMVNKNK